MPWSSLASASMRNRPLTVLPTAGAVRSTNGGASAGGGGSLGPPEPATVHDALAPGDSTLPAGSVERTPTVCVPAARPLMLYGLVHGDHAAPSRRHSDMEPDSLTVKTAEASPESVCGGGADVIVVFGAVVSIENERVAGVESVLPAASVARTPTEWFPAASADVVHGLVHVAQEPLSTRHANFEPASVALNEKV